MKIQCRATYTTKEKPFHDHNYWVMDNCMGEGFHKNTRKTWCHRGWVGTFSRKCDGCVTSICDGCFLQKLNFFVILTTNQTKTYLSIPSSIQLLWRCRFTYFCHSVEVIKFRNKWNTSNDIWWHRSSFKEWYSINFGQLTIFWKI